MQHATVCHDDLCKSDSNRRSPCLFIARVVMTHRNRREIKIKLCLSVTVGSQIHVSWSMEAMEYGTPYSMGCGVRSSHRFNIETAVSPM